MIEILYPLIEDIYIQNFNFDRASLSRFAGSMPEGHGIRDAPCPEGIDPTKWDRSSKIKILLYSLRSK
jgi:hypothetical protein